MSLMSLTLCDFYFGPNNKARSIIGFYLNFLLYALMTLLLLLTPPILGTPLFLIVLFIFEDNSESDSDTLT